MNIDSKKLQPYELAQSFNGISVGTKLNSLTLKIIW